MDVTQRAMQLWAIHVHLTRLIVANNSVRSRTESADSSKMLFRALSISRRDSVREIDLFGNEEVSTNAHTFEFDTVRPQQEHVNASATSGRPRRRDEAVGPRLRTVRHCCRVRIRSRHRGPSAERKSALTIDQLRCEARGAHNELRSMRRQGCRLIDRALNFSAS